MSVFKKNLSSFGAFLTVQWLGLCTSSAGDVVQSLVGELGSYLLRGAPLTKKKKPKKNSEQYSLKISYRGPISRLILVEKATIK